MHLLTVTLAIFCLGVDAAGAEGADLTFSRAGHEVARYTAPQMQANIPSRTVTFFDPHHGKTKSYRCLPIKEVMDLAFGPGWETSPYTEAVLTALDGYASVATATKLTEDGGCLAFEDLDVPGREPVGRQRANPGPFYLIWTGEFQRTENEYPFETRCHPVRFHHDLHLGRGGHPQKVAGGLTCYPTSREETEILPNKSTQSVSKRCPEPISET